VQSKGVLGEASDPIFDERREAGYEVEDERYTETAERRHPVRRRRNAQLEKRMFRDDEGPAVRPSPRES
jgi:hypothetical protein